MAELCFHFLQSCSGQPSRPPPTSPRLSGGGREEEPGRPAPPLLPAAFRAPLAVLPGWAPVSLAPKHGSAVLAGGIGRLRLASGKGAGWRKSSSSSSRVRMRLRRQISIIPHSPICEGTEEELRERKKKNCKENKELPPEEKSKTSLSAGRSSSKYVACQHFVKLFFGCLAAITSGMMYAVYLSTYHERKFWFSTRPELEREITFQGDGAVYYSFYKELLRAPSFERGVFELTYNNKTLSMKTLNAVRQMSLYPELLASALYRVSGSEDIIEPMYFYIGIVFGLQGIYVTALFVTSWIMSGTWLAGMLTVAWFIINRTDTTRMEYSIPLRENWALPYFACQVAALTGYLKNINSSAERFCYFLVTASTYTFMVMWEYSHYLLFVQAICLLMMDGLFLVQKEKVQEVQKIYLLSLLVGYLLQFENSALLVSPLLSLVAGSMLASCIQVNMKRGTFIAKLMHIVYYHVVFTIAVTLHFVIKRVVAQKENGHVLPFLEAKFGLSITSGEPLKEKITLEDGQIGARPEVVYHIIHSTLLGSFTMVFEGVKYLWTPYVCIFAAFGVCSPDLWMTLFKWIRLKSIQPVLLALILSTAVPTVIGFSLWREHFPRIMMELSELDELYDLDTIELMNWIKREAPMAAVFAGSPQLMGAIKLCTGWKVTSLPLYNNEDLMKRNENLYQIYSMRSAEDIYKILTSYKATYVVIEDSICNEVGTEKGCRVKDLLDVANGHVVNEDGDSYAYSKYGRFCHEIKLNYSPYVNYFTRVYWNRSYFVYKINTVISFQY
ncbi:probable C-mannosyltransferase DPY19L4 isoform X2 [Rhinatrema bivittatum]|uniref:probable C-mannosyltransferase DPY19L4 isoform X2 n=1 Tax=Rhinatrema bivittatum TaxID=194408 RepID=UPI00112615E9|nr:probable C-mannosyltransferase DPY19L4 isoform X2 [Rhinatrema bivittatum]